MKKMPTIRAVAFILILLAGFAAAVYVAHLLSKSKPVRGKTIDQRVTEYGDKVDARLTPSFRNQGVEYPPKQLVFLGFKKEMRLEIWAAGSDSKFKFVHAYPILCVSGTSGPKLREGDCQVPEGFYKIESLNPNSLFHLALRVNYPNETDRSHAMAEGRTLLGGDIMIHGSSVSIGCLAMGDKAAEDLFVLAARAGIGNIRVILSPVDFRVGAPAQVPEDQPKWVPGLYEQLKIELAKFPKSN